MKEIILASSSPRRKEILERFGINPIIIKPNIKENIREGEEAINIVMGLAFQKAYSIYEEVDPGKVIIASDTVVVYDEQILGKPKDREDAFRILKMLNGKKHSVITGIAILESGSNKKILDFEETIVEFKDSKDERIRTYIDTGEPMDKAGAYGIQGLGQLLISRIEGSYLNVVGFPIEKVETILEDSFNISLL